MNEITEVIKSIPPGVVGAASGVVYTPIYNEDGEQIGTEPAPQKLTHGWAGWEV